MAKNVILISSSPRKNGNSDLLCNEFIKGAKEAGNNAEKIFLRDLKINYCSGCGYCNTSKECIQKDDMAECINKLINADVIVFATPIYFYSISGQMKTFIDRLCPKYNQISNKEIYYIMTAADTSKNTFQYALGEFKGLMACLKNVHEKPGIFANGVWQKGSVEATSYLQQAYKIGKEV